MQYKDEDLIKLQNIEKEILKEVIRVCDENNITYFSVGGTTLGAIRHQGFIPWDDDIDIGMLRDDYEKFLQIAPTQLNDRYYLQYFGNEKNVMVYFAKVRCKGTKFVEWGTLGKKMGQGVFIDIMPFDNIPDNEKERIRHRNISTLWRQLLLAKGTYKTLKVTSWWKKLIGGFIRTVLHIILIPIPSIVLFMAFDNHLRKYNNIKTKHVSSRGYEEFECLLSDLVPVRLGDFENMKINIPGNAEKVLEIQYGDYMTLPPEEKRITHKPVILEL